MIKGKTAACQYDAVEDQRKELKALLSEGHRLGQKDIEVNNGVDNIKLINWIEAKGILSLLIVYHNDNVGSYLN